MVLPTPGELLFTATNTTDFNQYEVNPVETRYVKIMGYGRFNAAGDTRVSVWSAVGEIELYGSELVVDVNEIEAANKAILHPNPVKDILHIKNMIDVDLISIYNMDGRKMMDKRIINSTSSFAVDLSLIPNGQYILILKGGDFYQSELINIAH
jgi:poly(beta-D-mannuronate) lyase